MALADFIASCRSANERDDHFGALALALTIPEICAACTDPGTSKSRARYVQWWATFVQPRHTYFDMCNLTAEDAYLLRCSFLHAGTDQLEGKRSGEVLQRVVFTSSGFGNPNSHLVDVNGVLQIDVAMFVEEVLAGVTEWMAQTASDESVQLNLSGLVSIHDMRIGPLRLGNVAIASSVTPQS